jgi:hypothetical protein
MKRILLVLLFAVGSYGACSQSTIAYTPGPAFQTYEGRPTSLDVDRNGSPDFSFILTMPACGPDPNYCSTSYFVTTAGTNAILTQNGYAAALSAGDRVGPESTTNGVWSLYFNTMGEWWWDPSDGTRGANGPLATVDEAYVGVRFEAAGGLHYGWVRVRQTLTVDWAYETRPGVPITAGAKPVPLPLAPPQVVRPGYLRLKAATEPGKAYQVQAKGDLSEVLWTNLSCVIPSVTTNIAVDLPMTAPAQFFRVVEAD